MTTMRTRLVREEESYPPCKRAKPTLSLRTLPNDCVHSVTSFLKLRDTLPVGHTCRALWAVVQCEPVRGLKYTLWSQAEARLADLVRSPLSYHLTSAMIQLQPPPSSSADSTYEGVHLQRVAFRSLLATIGRALPTCTKLLDVTMQMSFTRDQQMRTDFFRAVENVCTGLPRLAKLYIVTFEDRPRGPIQNPDAAVASLLQAIRNCRNLTRLHLPADFPLTAVSQTLREMPSLRHFRIMLAETESDVDVVALADALGDRTIPLESVDLDHYRFRPSTQVQVRALRNRLGPQLYPGLSDVALQYATPNCDGLLPMSIPHLALEDLSRIVCLCLDGDYLQPALVAAIMTMLPHCTNLKRLRLCNLTYLPEYTQALHRVETLELENLDNVLTFDDL